MTLWSTVPLAEVAEIVAGITLGRKANVAELIEVPYMRVANVLDGVLDLSDVKTISATPSEITKLALRDGDLLLTEGGDPDKLGRGACWRGQLPVCVHQNHIFRVRLDAARYDPEFVSLQIGSPYGKSYFLAHAKQTTGIATINQRVLGAFPLLSPPIEKQQAIAARLKAQLVEAETARRAARVQHQDAAALRDRVLREILTRYASTPRKVLGDHAHTTSGSTPPRGDKRYWQPGEVSWVKTSEVAFAPVTTTEESVSRLALADCSLTLLPPKTVLVAMYGQGKTRGQSAILEIEATTNQACFAILPNDTWEPEFLYFWLVSSYKNLRHLSDDRGGNQANLNGALLNKLEIPAPASTDQQQTVLRIKAAFREIDALTSASEMVLDDLGRLPQRILAQAFEN